MNRINLFTIVVVVVAWWICVPEHEESTALDAPHGSVRMLPYRPFWDEVREHVLEPCQAAFLEAHQTREGVGSRQTLLDAWRRRASLIRGQVLQRIDTIRHRSSVERMAVYQEERAACLESEGTIWWEAGK